MVAGAVYTTTRACEVCRQDLPAGSSVNRRFCDACGKRRRIVTFLRQAQSIAGEIPDEGMVRQLDGLIRRTGVASST